MYSMAAFGPVIGFLLGAYLLSFHMDWFSSTVISIGELCRQLYFRNPRPNELSLFVPDPSDRRFVGLWWGGFAICGLLLIIVAIPFFSFPKVSFDTRRGLSLYSAM